MLELASPGTAAELTAFLLPGISLPADRGVVIYWAVPPFVTFSTLGVLHAGKPSAVFRTGWPTNPEVASQAVVQVCNVGPMLLLGIHPEDEFSLSFHCADRLIRRECRHRASGAGIKCTRRARSTWLCPAGCARPFQLSFLLQPACSGRRRPASLRPGQGSCCLAGQV